MAVLSTTTSSQNTLPVPSDGIAIGSATSDKIGMHGATPVVQRTSASQAAVATTAPTQTSPWGFSTSAQAAALITLVNEIRAMLVERGDIKGS